MFGTEMSDGTRGTGSGSGETQQASATGAGGMGSTEQVNESEASSAGGQSASGASGANGSGVSGASEDAGSNTGAVSVSGDGSGTSASKYIPSYKFKVKDKELEFDEFVRPTIKTKDEEAKLRELYEKAHGIEEVKAARETFKTQAEEWKNKFTTVEGSLQTLGSYVRKKDFNSFFQTLNIPKEEIINYAIQELKYQELPPEQRAQLDAQREREREYEQTVNANQMLQTQMAQLHQQQTAFELSQALAGAEVSSLTQAFDVRAGKPGAFRDEVIKRGQWYEAIHKISPPASQLVAEVIELSGIKAVSSQSLANPQGQPGQVVQNQQEKPVIPSFQGGGTKSPARKVPTSIDDLKAIRAARP